MEFIRTSPEQIREQRITAALAKMITPADLLLGDWPAAARDALAAAGVPMTDREALAPIVAARARRADELRRRDAAREEALAARDRELRDNGEGPYELARLVREQWAERIPAPAVPAAPPGEAP